MIFLSLSQRQIASLGPLEWRYHFRPKDKVASREKLVFRSGVQFLFVLMDAILLNLDLQKFTKKDNVGGHFFLFPLLPIKLEQNIKKSEISSSRGI